MQVLRPVLMLKALLGASVRPCSTPWQPRRGVLKPMGVNADQPRQAIDGFIQTQNDGKIVVEAQYAKQIGNLLRAAG